MAHLDDKGQCMMGMGRIGNPVYVSSIQVVMSMYLCTMGVCRIGKRVVALSEGSWER
jgi:hypothetical protein